MLHAVNPCILKNVSCFCHGNFLKNTQMAPEVLHIDEFQIWLKGVLRHVLKCFWSKFDKNIPKGTVPNSLLGTANHYPTRSNKCKLKPPKKTSEEDKREVFEKYKAKIPTNQLLEDYLKDSSLPAITTITQLDLPKIVECFSVNVCSQKTNC